MNQEDPAVSMARRLLHQARQEFNEQEQEEIKMAKQMTVTCCECGETVLKKGCRFKEVDGKRLFVCPGCQDEPVIKRGTISIEGPRPARKTCFFCNGDTFHMNLDGSIQCAGCQSIFFKGPSK